MPKQMGLLAACIVALQLLFVTTADASVYGTKSSEVKKEISPQVYHIKENYVGSSTRQAINILDVNLANTYTDIQVGLPTPENSLKKTSSIVSTYNKAGNRVVGAVNASYFLSNGMPANLIAVENEIVNYGILGQNTESPTQKPIAFGISKNGTAIIDYYTTNLTFTIGGETFPIDFINNSNVSGKITMHTVDKKTTNTAAGLELVFTKSEVKSNDLHFGQKFTATLTSKLVSNSTIPADGFVLSIADPTARQKLSKIANGTEAEFSVQIDPKWQDAEFILAAGPLLVKDGKQNISMSTSSSFASGRNPRTAVAVDATGKRVFLVTVDGRQSGYSNGTSLKDLSNYLISMGAQAAINLDGGGSTTMLARSAGQATPVLVNKPSDGGERSVSAILQVINNAPAGNIKGFQIQKVGTLSPDDKVAMKITDIVDEYLNPASLSADKITWKVEGGIGVMNGSTFTATKSGTGKIIGTYNGIVRSVPVTVMSLSDKPYVLDSLDSTANWKVSNARANAGLAVASSSEPYREGKGSFKLTYDFTTGEAGTKAAYAIANTPVSIISTPDHIGVWVYGDGNKNWLRGMIIDGSGTKHTIDFTEENKLNFNGWQYVQAKIPSNLSGPFKFERFYVVQTNASMQKKGTLYFDQLQAVYDPNYVEPTYTDVKGHWAAGAIDELNKRGLIKGYANGTFGPSRTITRAQAAVIISRALNLPVTTNTEYKDVSKSHYAYSAIQAVTEANILTGRAPGQFSPQGELTRAETASVLKRAFDLNGSKQVNFTDLPQSHWAYSAVATLVANNLVAGYADNTFRPSRTIDRAEFAAFLVRTLEK